MKNKKNNKRWIIIAGVTIFLVAGFLYAFFMKDSGKITVSTATHTPVPTEKVEDEPRPTEVPAIYVYVCGAVKSPGLYKMPYGTRGLTAVEMAGGFDEKADRDYLNLAAVLCDGQRLYIPFLTDTENLAPENRIDGTEGDGGGGGIIGKVNINTASIQELMTLSGIGEARARDIIEYRTKVGAFITIEEIMNVTGIGEARFEKIKDSIRVK